MNNDKKSVDSINTLLMAVEHSPESIVITDVSGSIVFVNPKFTQLTGYAFDEALGQNPRVLKSGLVPDAVYKDLWETILSGREWRGELLNKKKDGELYWESASISPVEDAEGRITHFVAVKEDITERKRIENRLLQLSSAVEQSPASVKIVGLDRKIIYVNPKFSGMFGYAQAEVIGRPHGESPAGIFDPDIVPKLLEAIKTGKEWHGELQYLKNNGDRIWVRSHVSPIKDASGNITSYVEIAEDISERKRAEKALQKREAHLAMSQKIGRLGSFEWDIINQKNEWSDQLFCILGVRRDEVKPSFETYLSLVHPDDRERVKSLIEDSVKSSKFFGGYEVRIVRPDGNIRWLSIDGQALADESGRQARMFGTMLDITERKQAEAALLKSEMELNAVISGSPIPQFVIDRDHRIIKWNEALTESSGIRAADVIYTDEHWKAFYREKRPCLADLLVDDAIEKLPLLYEGKYAKSKLVEGAYEATEFFPHMGKSGKWLFFTASAIRDSGGNVIGAVETLEDITERKRAEEALRLSEAKFRTMVENANDMIFTMAPGGYFTYISPSVEHITGYAVDAVVGQHFARFVHPDDLPGLQASFQKTLNGTFESCEFRMLTRDGTVRYVRTSSGIVPDGDRPISITGILSDITERKQAESILQARMRLMEFATSHSVREMLQKTLDEIGEITDSPIGFYHFVDADQQNLSLQAWSTRTLQEFCTARGNELHYPIDKAGVWADCVRQRRPVIHNDYSSLQQCKGMPQGHAAIIRELVVPILRGDRIVAILGVGNKPSDYNDHDVELVVHLADVAWEITERKRAGDALRASMEKFQLTFDQSPIGAAIASLDFRFLKVNGEFCRITGYTEQELLSKSIFEITYKDDVGNNLELSRKLAAGDIPLYEIDKRYVRKDGARVWVRVTARVLRDTDGSPLNFLALVQDISERRCAEEAISKKNRELELINSITSALNSSMSFDEKLRIVLHDTMEIISADAGAIYLLSDDSQEEMHLSIADVRTDAGSWARFGQILSRDSRDKSWHVEFSSVIPGENIGCDGLVGTVPLSVKGNVFGIMALYCDDARLHLQIPQELIAIGSQVGVAIENHRLFKKIRDTSHYLANIIDESPDPIVTMDANGTVLSFNKSAAHLLKYTPADIIGYSITRLLQQGQHIEITDGKSYVNDLVCKDGTLLPLSVSVSRLPMEGSRPGYIITLKDLSSIAGLKVVPIAENCIETKQLHFFEKGNLYLYDNTKDGNSMEVFADQVKHNIQGLCITRHYPKKIREQYGLEKTPIVWLTGNEGILGESCLKPDNLTGLSATINKFVAEAADGLILIDGLEYIMMRNNFESLMKFIHHLNDRVMISNCRVICCLDPEAFEHQQYHRLTCEMNQFFPDETCL